jgi:hypothetical protein
MVGGPVSVLVRMPRGIRGSKHGEEPHHLGDRLVSLRLAAATGPMEGHHRRLRSIRGRRKRASRRSSMKSAGFRLIRTIARRS